MTSKHRIPSAGIDVPLPTPVESPKVPLGHTTPTSTLRSVEEIDRAREEFEAGSPSKTKGDLKHSMLAKSWRGPRRCWWQSRALGRCSCPMIRRFGFDSGLRPAKSKLPGSWRPAGGTTTWRPLCRSARIRPGAIQSASWPSSARRLARRSGHF